MINNTYSFLGVGGTVQAAGADIVLNNHILTITGCPSMDYRKIIGTTGLVAPVAEVLQVDEYTPSVAASTLYTIVISQYNNTIDKQVQRTLTYFTQPSGDTATTICDAFRAQLLTLTDLQITGSGTTTLVLTAKTGSAVFTAVNNTPVASTIVTNTPGVVAIGTFAALTAQGITGQVAGQTYSTITFDWTSAVGESVGAPTYGIQRHTLYTNIGATNYAAFATKMTDTTNATAGGVANPETVSVAAS